MVILMILLYVVLQVVVPFYVRGPWRWAAAVSLIGMLAVVLFEVVERSPTNELTGLVFVLATPFAIIWLLIIAALFYVINRRTNQSPS